MIGILDPSGENPNPFNNVPYGENYKKLAKKWSALPAYSSANTIIDSINNNSVILIESGTGSGKTVLVPKYVLHTFNYEKKIAITLPKRMIAKSSAEYAAATLDVAVGTFVGYQFRGESSKSSNTKLLYATDGSIKSLLIKDPLLSEFSAVIIDEAHERKIQIDFLLFLLKNVLEKRDDFKLVIMSATINAKIFKTYYKNFKFSHIVLPGTANYPIQSLFLGKDESYAETLTIGKNLIKETLNKNDGDIIFFVSSQLETVETCNEYAQSNEVFCAKLSAASSNKDKEIAQSASLYKDIFGDKYTKKLVVATNVAESSLTIDGIKYVFDTGYEISSTYNPITRSKVLSRKMITYSQAKQRMGRTGRVSPGTCYHLYSEETFNKLDKYPSPEIKVSDLSEDSLKLLAQVDTVDNLISMLYQLIEPPEQLYIADAIRKLKDYKLTDDKITNFGRIISNINLDIPLAISLFYAIQYNCANEIIKIASFQEIIKANISEIFIKIPKTASRDMENRLAQAKKHFYHKYGDYFSLIKLFDKFAEINSTKIDMWCYKYFIKKDVMSKVYNAFKNKKRLRYSIEKIDIPNKGILSESLDKRILCCLTIGHIICVAKKSSRDSSYKTLYLRDNALDSNSFLELGRKLPSKIIYSESFISMTGGKPKRSLNMVNRFYKDYEKYLIK